MLTSVTLENFKSFGDQQSFPIAPITLIYGPNSGGKSSFIQSLILMKQSFGSYYDANQSLIFRGNYIDLGNYQSVLHQHDLDRQLSIGFKFRRERDFVRRIMPSAIPREAIRSINLMFSPLDDGPVESLRNCGVQTARYGIEGDQSFEIELERVNTPDIRRVARRRGETFFKWRNESWKNYLDFAFQEINRRRDRNRLFDLMGNGGDHAFPDHLHSIFNESFVVADRIFLPSAIINPEGESVRRTIDRDVPQSVVWSLEAFADEAYTIFNKMSYLGPLRSHPARHYLLSGGKQETVGIRGEYTPQVIFFNDRLKDEINKWFRTFDIPYEIMPRHIGNETIGEIISINLIDLRTKVEVSPSDVGFGIGQLLPIIVEGIASTGRVICVEQPEIHLHPRLQANLADLLVDTAQHSLQRGRNGNQWIVETHSESLMLRMQRHIRAGNIKYSDVSVVYIQPTSKGGVSIPLAIDEDGEFIDEWPDGFFEETFQELFGKAK